MRRPKPKTGSATARRAPQRSIASILAMRIGTLMNEWTVAEDGERFPLLTELLTSLDARITHIEARLP